MSRKITKGSVFDAIEEDAGVGAYSGQNDQSFWS
jgi:hypothetical protein